MSCKGCDAPELEYELCGVCRMIAQNKQRRDELASERAAGAAAERERIAEWLEHDYQNLAFRIRKGEQSVTTETADYPLCDGCGGKRDDS